MKMDGKSQEWRDAADRLLEALARDNKYIVGDMLIIFLESAAHGLDEYTALGGVFKRAAKKGIIKKVDRNTKQALWVSNIYDKEHLQTVPPITIQGVHIDVPEIRRGDIISLVDFGNADGNYRVTDSRGNQMSLETVE